MNSNLIKKNLLQIFLFSVFFLAFAFVVVSFFVPFFKAVSPAFDFQKNSSNYNFSKIAKITGYTFLQALISMMISILVGIPAAYLLANKKFWGQKILYSMGAIPLCVPALIVVLGYISTFGMNGFFNRLLMWIFKLNEAPIKFLYSFWGIIFVQGFYNFPLVMVTVADSWKTVDTAQADSARILGASEIKVFFNITLPQIFPSIISSCVPVFIYCFFSFMIVLLFGAPGTSTLELEIYHAGRSSLNFNLAAELALIETVSALALIYLWTSVEKKIHRNHSIALYKIEKNKIHGAKVVPVVLYFLLIGFCFVLPIISIALGSFTSKTGGINNFSFDGWKNVFNSKQFLPSLKNTLAVAFCTSIVCTVCGFFYSTIIHLIKNNRMSSFFNAFSLLSMTVSSVVIGIGFSKIFKNSSPAVLVLAQSALTWPFAFRQIYSHMIKIPQPVLDSGMILSKNKLDVVFKIIFPYSWRGIISAMGFCFAISAGDATLPLILSMQKFPTLSLFTYRLAGSYRFTEACGAGLLLGLICSVVFGFAKKIGGGKNVLS